MPRNCADSSDGLRWSSAAESMLAAGAAAADAGRQGQLAAQLQHRLEQHRRTGKPLVISCLNPAAPCGDCALLGAFNVQVGSCAEHCELA